MIAPSFADTIATADVLPTWEVTRIGSADVLVCSDPAPPPPVTGDRLHHLFEARCRTLGERAATHVAVESADRAHTYAELLTLSHQLANYLTEQGICGGARVAILMDRSILSHASVLALSMIGATYVPLDPSFPEDRVSFIVDDSESIFALTLAPYAKLFDTESVTVLTLDPELDAIRQRPATYVEPPADDDPLCYVIYTSGSTGKPKGVGIRHSSICNFVRVAASQYGYRADDRVYQGMTIAFDFSVEELWVPLCSGATLVPAPSDQTLLGDDLHDFLRARQITALCCVPTLLATLDPELPELRLLLVSGEACPRPVIEPWLTPGRRVLNAYGPTEITVTATWSVMTADRPVTIGGPLPTYSIVVLDPDRPAALAAGDIGEIAVAGPGLSDGYLNRPEQTAHAFVDDFIGLADNPTGRLYRTGDLGRINTDGQIEYLGRIDTQVKIRGYRIELGEIEAAARLHDAVAQCVVSTCDGPFGVELVAYLVPSPARPPVDAAQVHAVLRDELPAYMVPTYYEHLDAVPMLASTKVDRSTLPAPVGRRWVSSQHPYQAPSTEREALLAELLADVLRLDRVSVTADFFDDLGANSLTLAAYVAAIRADTAVRKVTMKLLYQNASITDLAAAIERLSAEQTARADKPAATPVVDTNAPPASTEVSTPSVAGSGEVPDHVPSPAAHVLTGVAQTLTYVSVVLASAIAFLAAYGWIDTSTSGAQLALRAVVCGSGLYFGAGLALIGVKWLAVGRFDTAPIPLWSRRYVRFWVAKTAINANPFNLLVGSPLYNAYLRLLGARVGRGAVLLCRPPICADLVRIGDRTVLRRDVVLPAYKAHRGSLRPGAITIGDDVLICDACVLDTHTAIGDNAQLGTTSVLLEGQSIPAGAVYQGSPAAPTTSNYDRMPSLPASAVRVRHYCVVQLAGMCGLTLPATALLPHLIARAASLADEIAVFGGAAGAVLQLIAASGVVYFGGLVAALTLTVGVPRLLNRFVIPGDAHPLYGTQYHLARGIHRFSNNVVLNTIFGDSAMILRYLRLVGYDLSKSTQTGSNFGVNQRHDSPFLCSFDRNTLVSDGLVMMNTEVSATSFRLLPIAMPPDTYLGNVVHYPPGAQVGSNCLIATKAAVPIDGPRRDGVGLLGSPAFEIPRSVARDRTFDHFRRPGVLEQRLALKLRSNVVTMLMYLARSWMLTFVAIATMAAAMQRADYGAGPALVVAAAATAAVMASLIIGTLLSILAERCVTHFRPLEPKYCSLYDEAFWAHERFWKLNYNAFLRLFDGTPMKPVLLRLQGARVGARLFDDGAGLTEPSMVVIGDDCMLNFGAALQCHSLEDGTFKSDRIHVGDRCTISTNGFVHYAATLADDALLEADSFLMKGSRVERGTRWAGNPAKEIDSPVQRRDEGVRT